MKFIDKLAWIEIKENTILMAKSHGKDIFYIPGGKREIDETDAEALIREIEEELSIKLDHSSLKLIGVFEAQAHGHAEGVIVRMTCYSGSYLGQISASSEIEAVAWYQYAHKHKVGPVDELIFEHLRQIELLK